MTQHNEAQRLREKEEIFSKYEEVADLIEKNLTEVGYREEVISNGQILWGDYAYSFGPEVRDLRPWVAAVEYAIARLEFNEKATQANIAAKYGISESSLSNKFRALCEDLELYAFDERYSTVKNPAQKNVELMRQMFGEDVDVRLPL